MEPNSVVDYENVILLNDECCGIITAFYEAIRNLSLFMFLFLISNDPNKTLIQSRTLQCLYSAVFLKALTVFVAP